MIFSLTLVHFFVALEQVRWVDKGPERAEALVSVSSDGRVTQWSMSKGLECSDLIKLKRVSTHKKVEACATRALCLTQNHSMMGLMPHSWASFANSGSAVLMPLPIFADCKHEKRGVYQPHGIRDVRRLQPKGPQHIRVRH